MVQIQRTEYLWRCNDAKCRKRWWAPLGENNTPPARCNRCGRRTTVRPAMMVGGGQNG